MTEKPDKLNNQAIMFANDGEYYEAIACFKRAITIQQDNYLLWYNLGITYRDSGDIPNARASLEKAHQVAPEQLDVLDTLSTLCINDEDYVAALSYSHDGIDLAPDNSSFWNIAGVALFNMEKFELASEHFEQALCRNPYDANALYNLRDTYEALHNHVGARECEKRMKEMGINYSSGR